AGGHRRRIHVAVADHVDHGLPFHIVVLDDEQIAALALLPALDKGESGIEILLQDRLPQAGYSAALDTPTAALIGRDDVDRNLTGHRILHQPFEHHPAGYVGHAQVERDRHGAELAGQGQRQLAAGGDEAFETLL